jgi:hypothetical protein
MDEIDVLSAEIGDQQLRMIGGDGKTSKGRAGRRTIGRWIDGREEGLGIEIEDIDVIGSGEEELLACGIVSDEFVQSGVRIDRGEWRSITGKCVDAALPSVRVKRRTDLKGGGRWRSRYSQN